MRRSGYASSSRRTAGSPIEKCTLEHEKDHISWFKCHPPYDQLCVGKPKDSKEFKMQPADYAALECAGYKVQYECMKNEVKFLSSAQKSDWFHGMNLLRVKAMQEFKCDTSGW